jgi:hypothetical protein
MLYILLLILAKKNLGGSESTITRGGEKRFESDNYHADHFDSCSSFDHFRHLLDKEKTWLRRTFPCKNIPK